MKHTFTCFLVVLVALTSCAQKEQSFEEKYKVTFIYTYVSDTWNKVTYDSLKGDEKEMFTQLIIGFLSKYPADFFEKVSLKYIILCKDLHFGKDKRAAVPDNYKNQMYYSYSDDYEDYYIAHTVFHEMNHFAEFSVWNDYRYNWAAWKALYNGNRKGGVTAYANSNIVDYYSLGTGPPGFLNLYSTLGEEEDRSDIIAFFMNDLNNEHNEMMKMVKADPILQKKLKLMLKFYKEHFGFGTLLETYNKEMKE